MATAERTHEAVSDISWDSARHALLVALLALYPFHRVTEVGVPATDVGFSANVSFGDPIVALVLLLWLVGLVGARRLPPYARLVAAFALVGLGSLLLNGLTPAWYYSLRTGAVELVKFGGAVAWFVAVFVLVSKRPSEFAPTAAAASVAVATLFAAAALYDVVVFEVTRQTGPFANPNIFGNYLVLNAALGLYLRHTWVADRWAWTRRLSLLAAAVVASAILATGSRGTLLGAGLAGVLVVLYSVRFSRRQGVVAAATAAVGFVASVAIVQWRAPFLTNRFLSAKNLEGRIELWTAALEAFARNPIAGIGFGQYQLVVAPQEGGPIGAHSTPLLFAAETGLVGLLALFALLVVVLWDGYELSTVRAGCAYLLAAVVAFAGQGLVTDVANFRAVWIAVGLLAAYSVATSEHRPVPARLSDRASALLPGR